jgi:hypothetical protein
MLVQIGRCNSTDLFVQLCQSFNRLKAINADNLI